MSEIENKLSNLKFKKAITIAEIEALSEVSDDQYTKLGKLEALIAKTKKQIVRATTNQFE